MLQDPERSWCQTNAMDVMIDLRLLNCPPSYAGNVRTEGCHSCCATVDQYIFAGQGDLDRRSE